MSVFVGVMLGGSWVVCLIMFVMFRVTLNKLEDRRGWGLSWHNRAMTLEVELKSMKSRYQVLRAELAAAAKHGGDISPYRQALNRIEKNCAACGKRCLRCATYIVQTSKGEKQMTFDQLLYREQNDPFVSAEDIESWIEEATIKEE